MSNPETNPDKRPLPDGWITEHSPQWNSWYYVDTKSPNPQAIWTHPAESNTGPTTPSPAYSSEPGAGNSVTSAPSSGGQPTNPDTRPLPPGFVSQYSPEHKTFFYVNESVPNPGSTVTWKHPADEHSLPSTDPHSPATASTQATHANPASPAAGGSANQNPDKRELPHGWKTDYDANYKAWYYVNTNDPSGTSSWTHPIDTHGPAAVPPASQPSAAGTSAAAPAAHYTDKPADSHAHAQAAPPAGPNPAQKENPDKRPLPTGWITKFDENYGVWYYIDTTKPGSAASWEHPAGNAPSTPVAGAQGAGTPYGGAPAANQPYGAQPAHGTPGAPGGGIEGLLGGSAGKMIGGLFGSKGRAQMDTFANKLSPEVQKMKGKYAGQGHGQGQPGHGQPGQGQQGYGAPQGSYGATAGHPQSPGQTPGYGAPPPSGQPGYPGQHQQQPHQQQGYNSGYPAGGQPQQQQQQHGGGGLGGMNVGGMNVGGLAGKLGGFLKK